MADGTPDGLRIVERSNWTGRALMVSRAEYPAIRHRDELGRPGVYLLRGQAERGGLGARIYIGEADTARTRIDNHIRGKDFWDELILFTSKDDMLNKAHIRYLESRLVELATDANQAELENNNAPQRPALSEPERDDAESFLENMLLIYPVLGVTAFELSTIPEPDVSRGPLLSITGPHAEARGRDTSEGFVVYAGSRARKVSVNSLSRPIADLREVLIEKRVLRPEGDHLVFVADHLFSSPSTAACVVLGRSANGRVEWKDESGRTLRAVQEDAIASPPPGSP